MLFNFLGVSSGVAMGPTNMQLQMDAGVVIYDGQQQLHFFHFLQMLITDVI